MEKLALLSRAASGLDAFFVGLAALWFVAEYREKK
jgi:hypothetical protein